MRCWKCGGDVVDGGDGRMYLSNPPKYTHIVCPKVMKNETTLQLLVIDLGESCVLRLETDSPFCISGYFNLYASGQVATVDMPFTELRSAIDAVTDSQKPVPRIERCGTTEPSYEIMTIDGNGAGTIYQTAYDALCELAGKELPVWTGSGMWTCLTQCDGYGVVPSMARDMMERLPFKVWRYTR